MLDHLTAGDLMIPLERYPHIPYWFTIRQAMEELEHCAIEIDGRKSLPRFVLIFDEEYQLMGTVRRRNLLRGLEPDFMINFMIDEVKKIFAPDADPEKKRELMEHAVDDIRKQAERQVSEIMQPIEETADYHDNIFQLIYDININQVSLLPVLQDNRVVGVVRAADVFHKICDAVL